MQEKDVLMPSYTYCTVAVGESYLKQAVEFHTKVVSYPNCHSSVITTNPSAFYSVVDCHTSPKITFDLLESDDEVFNAPPGYHDRGSFNEFGFNYNIKHRPIAKTYSITDADYIIFCDADWKVRSEYSEDGVLRILQRMSEMKVDFLFERPHKIGAGKHNSSTCFWKHKIDAYGLMNTSEFDDADVCNEQYMVFANNQKLGVFCEYWNMLYTKSQRENIWTFAEGVEIGMSTIVAKMKTALIPSGIMNNYYEFLPKYQATSLLKF